MARVFTGKVMIPGDKLDEFFAALEKTEKARKPFRDSLLELNKDFHQYLLSRYSGKTARKHSGIVGPFIDFLCRYTDVERIEDITRGIVNTHFQRWWKRKVWDSTTPNEIRVALRKFFEFLAEEESLVNEKVLDALT